MNKELIENIAREYVLEERVGAGITRLFREITLEIFLNKIHIPARVLDCGCGIGGVAIPLARLGCDVHAVDNKIERITELKKQSNDISLNIHYENIEELTIEGDKFDYVISRQFVPHFEDWVSLLKLKLTHCKPGGKLIFHHHSKDNIILSNKLALTQKARTSISKGYNKNTRFSVSVQELQEFCDNNECKLNDLIPVSFFLPRGMLYRTGLNKSERISYEKNLDEWMQSEEIYKFIKWYETEIMQKMPPELSSSFIVIMEKSDS